MSIKDNFVSNEDVKLHYLDGNEIIDYSLKPLLHIPGAFGSAESFLTDLKSLSPRRVISMSQRGRGKSDVPTSGYTFENLMLDIQSIVEAAKLKKFYLYAFSLGVPAALGYACKFPEKIEGLIIGDYPAKYPRLSEEWIEKFLPYPELVNPKAVLGTQRESKEVHLWDELKMIQCPVLILTGGNAQVEPKVVLSKEELERYRTTLSDVSIVKFIHSGHRLWEPDHEKYIITIKEFLHKHDK